MKNMMPQNWNDTLSLIIIFLIPFMWILNGKEVITIGPEVTGALIATWTMVLQFYFRKSKTEK